MRASKFFQLSSSLLPSHTTTHHSTHPSQMTSISHDCCASILPATILIISFSKQRQFLISNNDGEFLLVFNDDVVCPLTMIFSSMFVASLLVVALFVILTQER